MLEAMEAEPDARDQQKRSTTGNYRRESRNGNSVDDSRRTRGLKFFPVCGSSNHAQRRARKMVRAPEGHVACQACSWSQQSGIRRTSEV